MAGGLATLSSVSGSANVKGLQVPFICHNIKSARFTTKVRIRILLSVQWQKCIILRLFDFVDQNLYRFLLYTCNIFRHYHWISTLFK
jgi:hypothetical protein